jgi:PHD/YefM family antitoxin component YafN of YafNO toxin-antitoxin module
MNRIHRVKEKVNINVDDYVNTSTGEPLTDELKNDKSLLIVTKENDKYIIISSDDYCILDSQVMLYLGTILKKAELASIILMAQDTRTPINLVYNSSENMPHTNETLQQFLGYGSKAMFINLIRSLMKIGVLYQIKGKIHGEVRVIYMLNPFISRKRKQVDAKLAEVFENYSKAIKEK